MSNTTMAPTTNAASTAIRGNRSSRKSFILKSCTLCFVLRALYFVIETQVLSTKFKVLSSKFKVLSSSSGHHQSDLFLCCDLWIHFADNATVVNDEQTI